jgi:uncharacterized iron-regulated protein
MAKAPRFRIRFRLPLPRRILSSIGCQMKLSPLSIHYRRLGVLTLILSAGCAPAMTGTSDPLSPGDYRLFDVAAREFVSVGELADEVADADVVFFGEFHDDQGVHRAQRQLLELLAGEEREVVLGLEMFERDVQPVLDRYVRRETDEATFLAESRPWPNYSTDYRPLVELARREGWPVIGTNLPQALATAVARGGLQALEEVSPGERRMAAEMLECPQDAYWLRFLEAIMGEDEGAAHSGAGANPMMMRVYEAQCARDETMAEAIAPIVSSDALLVHVNGSFHTDHFLGIVPRLLRRSPSADVRVIATVQVSDLAEPDLQEHLDRADYLILTPEPPEV